MIICDWDLNQNVLSQFDKDYEDEDEDDYNDLFWEEIVCRALKNGFLIIYTYPVPSDIKKENGKVTSFIQYGFGYTQTRYIHLEDLSNLTDILSNLDNMIIEEIWDKENERKSDD